MKRLALLASIAALLSGPAMAEDHIAFHQVRADTCSKVLGLESFITRRAKSADGWMEIANYEQAAFNRYQEASGYIGGYLSAINVENHRHGGDGHLFKNNLYTEVWPWVLSWCRANPARGIYDAVSIYVDTVAGNRP
jgi:hypothetical protein